MNKLNKNYVLIALLAFVGLVSSFWQTVAKINILKDPSAIPSCNLNPVIDCGIVLDHRLSALFGFPNSLLGIVLFSVILTLSLALLLGVKPNKQYKLLLLGFTGITYLFSLWFFVVSLYVIGKICVFCIAIWGASIPLAILAYAEFGLQILPKSKLYDWKLKWLKESPWQPIVLIYTLMIVMYLYQFKDYYFGG